MRIPTRQRSAPVLPGVVGTARVDSRTARLLPRLRPGDVAVIDHRDLDRRTAQAFVDAGVAAVVNVSPVLSGRYPALGPAVLLAAGITLVDGLGGDALRQVSDGVRVRVDEGAVHTLGDAPEPLAAGRAVDQALLDQELAAAREGMVSQLESFTHNSTEFLRREQDVLLHGQGVPRISARTAGRPAVVVVPGRDHAAELAAICTFVREQDPLLIGVDRGAEALRAAGLQPHVVVIDADGDENDLPRTQTVRNADDLVVVVGRGATRTGSEQWERLGLRPSLFESAATAEDAALLLADSGGASLIVGVGMHATLDEFLDRRRSGLASTYLTRLKVGEKLVDAAAVPMLYSGRVRPRHLAAVGLAGLAALAVAVGTTAVGQGWATEVAGWLSGLAASTSTSIEGIL